MYSITNNNLSTVETVLSPRTPPADADLFHAQFILRTPDVSLCMINFYFHLHRRKRLIEDDVIPISEEE